MKKIKWCEYSSFCATHKHGAFGLLKWLMNWQVDKAAWRQVEHQTPTLWKFKKSNLKLKKINRVLSQLKWCRNKFYKTFFGVCLCVCMRVCVVYLLPFCNHKPLHNGTACVALLYLEPAYPLSHMPVCHPTAYLSSSSSSVCLPIRLSVCHSVIHLSSVCLSIYLFVRPSVCLSVCHFACTSTICLSVRPSVFLALWHTV
jgi:hypothetical protein